MSLVVFTGFAGMIVAPDDAHPLRAAAAVLCIALGAGAAAVINMWYERDLDALMARTRRRPIPAGRMAPAKALAFGRSEARRVGNECVITFTSRGVQYP